MRVKIFKTFLENLVSLAEAMVPARKNLSYPASLLFSASDNSFSISANNLRFGAKLISKEVQIEEEGSFLVPAKLMKELASSLPETLITLSANRKLNISADNFHAEIQLEDLSFPSIPDPKEEKLLISATSLKKDLRHVLFSCAEEKGNFPYEGVLIKGEEDSVSFVGLDGIRLSLITEPIKSKIQSLIVPASAVRFLLKILSLFEFEQTISVDTIENQVIFFSDSFVFYTLQLSGKYPEFRMVTQTSLPYSIEIKDKEELLTALRLASSFPHKVAKLVFKNYSLQISSLESELGFSSYLINLDSDAPECYIALNSELLYEAIDIIEDKAIKLSFGSPTDPIKIEPLTYRYVHILMPIRI